MQRGEAINQTSWVAVAQDVPDTFSPLCGFTVTYLLNQSRNPEGLAWYNDTGQPPQPADLHTLVVPGSLVGTAFNGTVIQNDPAYTGGTVGFALIGPSGSGDETHYTNASYDTLCSGCTPPGPWVTALMYASTVTPNAYYVCFEDGPTSSTSWSNDGDFNDDVYFVTGITCLGGGQPCDTGKPGICEAGITQCAGAGTTCQELNPPAATETCNGLDDNCNGQIDEGAPCPTDEVCLQGTCVHACGSEEFPCQGTLVCESSGYCVDPRCVDVTCPTGEVCVAGVCKGPCDGIVCPNPQVCRVGTCVDACAGVTCQSGQVCTQGVCVADCNCQPCAGGLACDAASGECLTPACVGVTCGAGTYCSAGTCVDDCTGAVCPPGQTCTGGSCVEEPDDGGATGAEAGLTKPDDDGGGSSSGAGNGGDAGSTAGGGGGSSPGGAGTSPAFSPAKSGCGCHSVGESDSNGALVWGTAVAAIAVLGSRRRRRR
jgi:MYXO-CTERM domain-containing protein